MATAALLLIPAAISAVGAIQQGQAKQQAGQYNQAVANNNALAAQYQGAFQVDRIDDSLSRTLGSARAQAGASGIKLEGTPLDVLADATRAGALDKAATTYNADQQAANLRAQGALAASAGDAAMTSSLLQAGGTIGGAATTYGLLSAPAGAAAGSYSTRTTTGGYGRAIGGV